ncbi:uncharacterized protein LOC120270254 [Dioscorea cayenensis subsp. rotundata]|uniref:Uncharacterized protein LOC120270254 n=1 Tax=Dioscorea cayennensis subsp. rotundata TaxID=55577 RepID=A0AB40C0C2_DIOCR|nr:uncharacterized protein LOC120270254 [Dioscorea cayenensis subsp. rotundata]
MVTVRKQALKQSFETLQMEDGESIQCYCARVVTIVNQMKAMEESRDLSKLTLDELTGSLQAHEIRVNRSAGKVSEKALVMKAESSGPQAKEKCTTTSSAGWSPTRGRGRGFSRGRGRGRWSRGQGSDSKAHVRVFFYCKKYGHVKAKCRERAKSIEKGASLVVEEQGSHECQRSMFTSLDETQKVIVRLGDDKEMVVLGVGTVTGYSVLFRENECIIKDGRSGESVVVIPKLSNNMFPVDLSRIERLNLAVSKDTLSELWHRRFGHMNYRSLEKLAREKGVHGLPKLKLVSQCEECASCKHAKGSFPATRIRRSSGRLQLEVLDLLPKEQG